MSAFNIFNMASGEELGRFFARSADEALNALARYAGFETFEQACGCDPAIRDQVLIVEL